MVANRGMQVQVTGGWIHMTSHFCISSKWQVNTLNLQCYMHNASAVFWHPSFSADYSKMRACSATTERNVGNIFRSQSFERPAHFLCACVWVFHSCQQIQWAAYITKEISHHFAREKTPNSLVHNRKYALHWGMDNALLYQLLNLKIAEVWHLKEHELRQCKHYLSMSIKYVYSTAEWQRFLGFPSEMLLFSYESEHGTKT